MVAALAYPHIVKNSADPAHLQRLPRLRVSQIVADYLAHGWSPEEMCRQHPGLTLSETHSAMAYYFDNAVEIDAELQAELEQVDADRRAAQPSNFVVRMRAQSGSSFATWS
jgi:hypothetical protein